MLDVSTSAKPGALPLAVARPASFAAAWSASAMRLGLVTVNSRGCVLPADVLHGDVEHVEAVAAHDAAAHDPGSRRSGAEPNDVVVGERGPRAQVERLARFADAIRRHDVDARQSRDVDATICGSPSSSHAVAESPARLRTSMTATDGRAVSIAARGSRRGVTRGEARGRKEQQCRERNRKEA